MALRSLDNALPEALERPKKLPKVTSALPAKTISPAASENMEPTPHPKPADQAAEYIASENLKPLNDPEASIKNLLEVLNSKDWAEVCAALNDVRRLALHHSFLLQPVLEKVVLVLVKAMKNPRSALCKSAIMTSTDIFQSFGHILMLSSNEIVALDNLLLQLLLKASQDKKFVCEEAEKALEKMAGNLSPLPLLNKLQSYARHSNLRVRAKAAVAISKCVSKMGFEVMNDFGLANLLQIAAELLNDRLPEAREAARSIISSIYNEHSKATDTEEENSDRTAAAVLWHDLCFANLPPVSAESVEKIVLH